MADERDHRPWLQGYACAVATMVQSHDIGLPAEEALAAAGLTSMAALEVAGVDEIDVDTLGPMVRRMEARHA